MQDKNNSGLRFYAPSADAQLRVAVLRAYERAVAWSRIEEVLVEEREDAETVPDLLDQLEPERHEETTDDHLLLLRSMKNAKPGCD